MTWLEDLDQVAGQATCSLLKNDGINAALWATTGAAIATPEPASSVAGAVAGLGLVALQNGCEYDPNSGTPVRGAQTGCSQISEGGYGGLYRMAPNGNNSKQNGRKYTSLSVDGPYFEGNQKLLTLTLTRFPNNEVEIIDRVGYLTGYAYNLVPEDGATCAGTTEGISPNPPAQVIVGDTTNCTFNVEFKSWWTGPEGVVEPVFKISSENQLRSEEEVIGGCNFNPIIVVGGSGGGRIGGGPPAVGPWNPSWDFPGPETQTPWGDFVRDLVGGLIGNVIFEQLSNLLEKPWAGTEYRINPSCEDQDPDDPEQPVVIPIPALKGESAILTRIDALVPLLQHQKDLKQPICRDKPKLEGQWRTISFRSEQTSPFGKSRLRKRFRYRSMSGFGLEQLVDYWAGFSFQAGPVCVIHKGARWGTPQVWAASADEGKRVIRHAAGEAGIDTAKDGEWIISGSDSARVGVSGTMKVDTTGGYYWITIRDGSSERPIVAKT